MNIFFEKQFFAYTIIGALGAFIDIATFGLLYISFGKDQYIVFNFVSYIFGTVFSFILNLKINFKVNGRLKIRLLKYFLVALIGLSISSIFIYFCKEIFGIDPGVSKIFSLVLVLLVQYSLNRTITFNEADKR